MTDTSGPQGGNPRAQLSAKAQSQLGLWPGAKFWSPFPFAGMNLSASRPSIDDKQFYYIENFVRAGDGYLRTAWDKGAPFFVAPFGQTILSFFWYNIGSAFSCAVFFTDGTAVSVAYPSGTVTSISNVPGTFYQAGASFPACGQSGTQYLIISNNFNANCYWLWDGTLLYTAGGISPIVTITDGGAGYSSPPTIVAYGGEGSGLSFLATVNQGAVVAIQVLDPGAGYQPGDNVQLAFSGGGTDSSAILQAVLEATAVQYAIVTNGGSDYATAPTVNFTGGAGTGAAATAVVSNGAVVGITITPAGTGATGTATVTDNAVASVSIGAGGSGYISPPTVNFSGGGGTGAEGRAVISGGAVTAVVVTKGGSGYTGTPDVLFISGTGSGYTSAPMVSFSGGGGTGATGEAFLAPTSVASVTVVDGGSGFAGTPTLQFIGGGGTGVTDKVNISGGSITSVTVKDGGSGYTDAPAVVVQTGVNNSAAATIAFMPFGVSGSAIETYQSRVFLVNPFSVGPQQNGGTLLVSAPESLTDYATSDGGLLFTSTDRFLKASYTNIRQTNSYLYPFGDSSVSVISNLQTVGNPTSTTFNYQNVDPQVGLSWRDSAQDFSRTILFANQTGVYGLYGGAVTKVSKDLDQLFTDAIFPPTAGAVLPSSATATLFDVKHYLLLMTVNDFFTGKPRNVMVGWNEKEWAFYSQSATLTYIGTQEISSALTAWGTDGTNLFPMFDQPSADLAKILQSKLYGTTTDFIIKDLKAFYMQAQDVSESKSGIDCDITADTAGLAIQNTNVNTGGSVPSLKMLPGFVAQPVFPSLPPFWSVFGTGTTGIPGANIGFTLASMSPDFVISNLMLAYVDEAAVA